MPTSAYQRQHCWRSKLSLSTLLRRKNAQLQHVGHVHTLTSRTGPDNARRGFRYLILAMPAVAFALGTWQVQRRQWKLELIDEATDRLKQKPVTSMHELHLMIDGHSEAGEGQPVQLQGHYDHRKEMLVGPRQRDGQTGYHVITPFYTNDGPGILVNRGWISKSFAHVRSRAASTTNSVSQIFGLLRRTTVRNLFTPGNNYAKHEYYFVDIEEMSRITGTESLLLEVTVDPQYATVDMEESGVPVGKPHEVLLRNNHLQYIITW